MSLQSLAAELADLRAELRALQERVAGLEPDPAEHGIAAGLTRLRERGRELQKERA